MKRTASEFLRYHFLGVKCWTNDNLSAPQFFIWKSEDDNELVGVVVF